jgi:AcrR family transcriptional regulator
VSATRAAVEGDRTRLVREAAEEVFLRDGYAAATMDDVARRAGMSKRTLYQLFPSKAALFEAMLGMHLAPFHIDLPIEQEPDLVAALSAHLGAFGRHFLTARQSGIFRLIVAEVHRSPELADAVYRAGPGAGTTALERRVAAEMARGTLRPGDPKAVADLLLAMAFSNVFIEMLLGLRGPPEAAEIERRLRDGIATFLHGTAACDTAPGPLGGRPSAASIPQD